jgi:hypothetical protein
MEPEGSLPYSQQPTELLKEDVWAYKEVTGENCVVRSFTVSTSYQILPG